MRQGRVTLPCRSLQGVRAPNNEIKQIIECLREAEEEIPHEKTFYRLNALPASWHEWRYLQATILKPAQQEDLIAAVGLGEATMNRDKAGSTGNEAVLAVQVKGHGYCSSALGSGGVSTWPFHKYPDAVD